MTEIQSLARLGYRKYRYDEKILFLMNPQTIYWFGFIAADGNVYVKKGRIRDSYTLSIGLQKKDLYHLLEFCKYINLHKTPYFNKGMNSYQTTIYISKELYEHMTNIYHIVPHKSLILTHPNIDYELIPYFITGYIDGDGSWNISKRDKLLRLGIRGTNEMLSWIKEYIDNNFPSSSNKVCKVSISDGYPNYQITGKRALNIFNSLKELDIYKLARKWGGPPGQEKFTTAYDGQLNGT